MPNALGQPTLGDLIDEIADDIERADLDPQIRTAVERAIRHYQPERFFFNEAILTFQTLAGSDVYSRGDTGDLPDLMAIDSVVLIEDGRSTVLTRMPETSVEAWDDQASASRPCAYSYFDRSIRLWPIPSDALTVRIAAHVRLPVPVTRADANAWTDEASSLIAAHAKRHLARNVLRSPSLAVAQTPVVDEEERALRGRSNVIASSGQVAAYNL